jgi:hypothetical protein
MDKNGFFGEMLEKGQQTVGNTVKSAVSDVAGSVAMQIGIKQEPSPDNQGSAQTQGQTNPQNQSQQFGESASVQAASTDETKQFVKEFYSPSVDLPANLTPELAQQMQQKDKLESQQKLTNLRHELHKEGYYDPLIAHETRSEQESGDDSAAKRVEKQEQEEEQGKMQLEEKKAQDDQDIAKVRAQTKTEANRGAMG